MHNSDLMAGQKKVADTFAGQIGWVFFYFYIVFTSKIKPSVCKLDLWRPDWKLLRATFGPRALCSIICTLIAYMFICWQSMNKASKYVEEKNEYFIPSVDPLGAMFSIFVVVSLMMCTCLPSSECRKVFPHPLCKLGRIIFCSKCFML